MALLVARGTQLSMEWDEYLLAVGMQRPMDVPSAWSCIACWQQTTRVLCVRLLNGSGTLHV